MLSFKFNELEIKKQKNILSNIVGAEILNVIL